MTIFIVGIVVGFIVGRVYGWMKYSFPESQELIQLKIAEAREKRVAKDLSIERMRKELDEILRQRAES